MKRGRWVYLMGGSLISLLLGIIVTIIIPAQDPVGPSALARPYTELELEGREIYKREGCHYCHSQQVRAPEAGQGMVRRPGDIGPESAPGDYYYQSPVFWGTQRQGPDLAHVASREGVGDNPAWHLAHFKNPRGISPGTLMPSYDYLSDGELEALVAYMLTLK
ncbi:MAG: cbb3-type cytochrome c oxidase subunit II [Chloroflexi bacterium]|nr:cbb3-type cytochrome c oxidase subunit II [Chloroflexota bacterium]MCI0575094.1 cbb3-type cytochrome c oxidase subunit II [Chloroflexota bacterium]MCI0648204.1 cbb3-type cytochrome c oxidase subunit II [Chloroflexota bacterium]MCI0730143.1 cbb3-type cytochrome c oxidase subunit II [Chloroflexota bacterium]